MCWRKRQTIFRHNKRWRQAPLTEARLHTETDARAFYAPGAEKAAQSKASLGDVEPVEFQERSKICRKIVDKSDFPEKNIDKLLTLAYIMTMNFRGHFGSPSLSPCNIKEKLYFWKLDKTHKRRKQAMAEVKSSHDLWRSENGKRNWKPENRTRKEVEGRKIKEARGQGDRPENAEWWRCRCERSWTGRNQEKAASYSETCCVTREVITIRLPEKFDVVNPAFKGTTVIDVGPPTKKMEYNHIVVLARSQTPERNFNSNPSGCTAFSSWSCMQTVMAEAN